MYGHKYTDEEKTFMQEFIPGHKYIEIQSAFSEKFGWDIKISQIKSYMANNKINSGTKGYFPKGHIPVNKGKKGQCAPGCEKTWFKSGHTPKNHRPVGSERITKDGYIEIKVAEPNKWRLKHRVIWENSFGTISKGKCIIFMNGDKTDVQLENLKLIERRVNARLNQLGLRYNDPDSMQAAVGVAELISAIGEAKRRISGNR